MKKYAVTIARLISVPLLIIFFSRASCSKDTAPCSGNNNPPASSATFVIDGKPFTCSVVSAISLDTVMLITASNPAGTGDDAGFRLSLKNSGKGTRNFDSPGNEVDMGFSTEGYKNIYNADCTNEITYTGGQIEITTFAVASACSAGSIAGSFSGRLAIVKTVTPYLCSDGTTATVRTELVPVSGSFAGVLISQ